MTLGENLYHVKTLCQQFEEHVIKYPDQVALIYKGEKITYHALNECANQLARHIRHTYKKITGQALTTNTCIPISVNRSKNYIIGILAILKAGAAYVPINPDYPDKRVNFILDDIDSRLIILDENYCQKFEKIRPEIEQIIFSDSVISTYCRSNLGIYITCRDLAYIIYTSGSTGKPKGILAEHINVMSQVVSADYINASKQDTFAFFSDVAFDSTTFEIWGALLHGATLFIPDDLLNLLSNPNEFKQEILSNRITIVLLTRSLFDLLYTSDSSVFQSLKYVLVGGEALTKNIVLSLVRSEYKPTHLINAYGPSENSTFCCTYEVTNDWFDKLNSVPIGRPYSNRLGYIVDRYMQLMPIGVVGEMCVGGTSLSRGYLNRPELTVEKFIDNPFPHESQRGQSKIYRTNDLVRWLPNGCIEYMGRNDFQVKLRGYRIELNEIEEALLSIAEINHSIVLLEKKENFAYLIGYYLSDQPIESCVIRKELQKILPEYMVPSVFIHLEHLPIMSNGKLDKRSLPAPKQEHQTSERKIVCPTEESIYDIWSETLEINCFSREESFFNLGGNSIAAMLVRKKIEDTHNIKVNIVKLFEHNTVKSLSKYIASLKTSNKQDNSHPESSQKSHKTTIKGNEPIAIIGMACRLPGIDDTDDFWDMLINEKSIINNFSHEELRHRGLDDKLIHSDTYVRRGAVFNNPYDFDADFFGYSVKDATLMDPQHRYFLEVSWEALENSGHVPDKFDGDIGVFASSGRDYYFMERVLPSVQHSMPVNMLQAILANDKDFLSSRVSYKLNLTGPSVTLQSACSSSLVSIQMACESLRSGMSDMALAGGVSIFYNYGYQYQEQMIESPDGYCRAFDKDAQGTVLTSGIGVVVLKRLSDAISDKDCIHAIIRGGAINNDGANKMAFTAPSVKGQSSVIKKALENSEVDPGSIDYVEAHGTGTMLGDPIEWTALHDVYASYRSPSEKCLIGSVKTNIGHTDSAAGVFGLIKSTLALKNRMLPATLNFHTLNPEIASFNTALEVRNTTLSWESKKTPRRSGLSSFGLGGTNAHVILEEYPQTDILIPTSDYHIIPVSAKDRETLSLMLTNLKNHLDKQEPSVVMNIAYTAQIGRTEFNERAFFIVHTCQNDKKNNIRLYSYNNLANTRPKIFIIANEFHDLLIELIEVGMNISGMILPNHVLSIVASKVNIEKCSIDFYQDISLCNIVTTDVVIDMDKINLDPKCQKVHENMKLMELIGRAWTLGHQIKWNEVNPNFQISKKVAFPGYVFNRKTFVLESVKPSHVLSEAASLSSTQTMETQLKSYWSEILGIKVDDIHADSDFFNFGGDSMALIDLFHLIKTNWSAIDLELDEIVEAHQFEDMYKILENKMLVETST